MIALQRRDDIVITNCSDYLATHPGAARSIFRAIVELRPWYRAMALQLRMPPRGEHRRNGARRIRAMHFVRNHANATYDRFAPPLSTMRALLREAMQVLNDPTLAMTRIFRAS